METYLLSQTGFTFCSTGTPRTGLGLPHKAVTHWSASTLRQGCQDEAKSPSHSEPQAVGDSLLGHLASPR